ncbi:MAG TPA: hypothetical protein VM260_02610, partial [Pirellula sp.]|nr:hypothetical protein [Pirellula sp.]
MARAFPEQFLEPVAADQEAKSKHATECLSGGFVGTDFNIHQDLKGKLPNQWRDFNKDFITVYLKLSPEKSKVAAGLACGAIW